MRLFTRFKNDERDKCISVEHDPKTDTMKLFAHGRHSKDNIFVYQDSLPGVNGINMTGTSKSTPEPQLEHVQSTLSLLSLLILYPRLVKHFYDVGMQFEYSIEHKNVHPR